MFFTSDLNFNFKDIRSRVSFLKLRTFLYRTSLSNFNNFTGVAFSAKQNYRFFNIFNLVNNNIKKPTDYNNFNYEIRPFSLLNNKFKLSLFLNSNFNFFYKFFKVILFNRVSFFLNSNFLFNLTKRSITHLLSKLIFLNAVYCKGNVLCINLLIFDKIVLDYLSEYFVRFDNSLLKNYFNPAFFFLKNNLFNILNFSNSFLKVETNFVLQFDIDLFYNTSKLNDGNYRELFRKAFEIYKVYRSYSFFSMQTYKPQSEIEKFKKPYKRVFRRIGRRKVYYFTKKFSKNDPENYKLIDITKFSRTNFRHWLYWKKIANKFFIRKQINRSRRLNISMYLFSNIKYNKHLFPMSLKKISLLEQLNGTLYDGYYFKPSKEGNFSFSTFRKIERLLDIPLVPLITDKDNEKKLTKEEEAKKLIFLKQRFYNERLF